MNTTSLLMMLLLLSVPGPGQKFKDADLKTGTLVDVRFEKDSRALGTLSASGGVLGQRRNDATYYEIDSGEMIYVAKRTLTSKGDKQMKLTVNAPVRFAIKGDDLYLLDEDGKGHKLSVEKKTLKKP